LKHVAPEGPARPQNGGGPCNCSPTYQAKVYDARAGRRISKTFATRTAVKHWRTDAIVAIRRGDLSADRGPTLEGAAEQWLAAVRAGHITNRSGDPYKPSAIRSYEQNLRLRVVPELGHLRVRDITTRDVQRLVDGLVRDGVAPATIDTALTPLRSLYRRAVARGEANPTRRMAHCRAPCGIPR
jgi:integrase